MSEVKYMVYSGDRDHPVVETRRTDKRVALQDMDIIQSILKRRAWMEEEAA